MLAWDQLPGEPDSDYGRFSVWLMSDQRPPTDDPGLAAFVRWAWSARARAFHTHQTKAAAKARITEATSAGTLRAMAIEMAADAITLVHGQVKAWKDQPRGSLEPSQTKVALDAAKTAAQIGAAYPAPVLQSTSRAVDMSALSEDEKDALIALLSKCG